MNASDILALARAGFSAQQIAALNSVMAAPQPALPAPQPAPVQVEQPAPAPAPQPDQTQEILKQLGIISGQITAAAINGSQQPPAQTADQILGEIIAPPQKEVK